MSRFTDKIDMRFTYVPSGKTDIAATFRRVRKQQQEAAEKQRQAQAEAKEKVRKIERAK